MSIDPNQNPYAPSSLQSAAPTSRSSSNSSAEAMRKKYLSHEAAVKSIGLLYLIGGGVLLLSGVLYLFLAAAVMIGGQEAEGAEMAVMGGVVLLVIAAAMLAIGVAQILLGRGLQKLAPWSKTPTIILSVIGLLGVPVGTMISAYMLYLLTSEKGTIVFSEKYARAIRQTPHIRYKTSIIVWIFIGLFVLMVIAALVGVVIRGE